MIWDTVIALVAVILIVIVFWQLPDDEEELDDELTAAEAKSDIPPLDVPDKSNLPGDPTINEPAPSLEELQQQTGVADSAVESAPPAEATEAPQSVESEPDAQAAPPEKQPEAAASSGDEDSESKSEKVQISNEL